MILVIHSFVRPAPGAFFRPDRIPLSPPRAAVVKDGRVFSGHRRLVLDGREHGGRLTRGEAVSKMIRVEPASWRVCSRRKLVSGGLLDPDHDAVLRIDREAPGWRPHSIARLEEPSGSTGHHRLGSSSALAADERASISMCDCQSARLNLQHEERRPRAPLLPEQAAIAQ